MNATQIAAARSLGFRETQAGNSRVNPFTAPSMNEAYHRGVDASVKLAIAKFWAGDQNAI